MPVIIGANGVEKIVELSLSEKEQESFNNSVKSVKDLFDSAKKIDKSL